MPHPRKHLKQTGDTHPPETEYDMGADEEPTQLSPAGEDQPQARASDAGAQQPEGSEAPRPSSSAGMRLDADTERYLEAARAEVRRKPLAYAGGAFAIGFLLAVVTRS